MDYHIQTPFRKKTVSRRTTTVPYSDDDDEGLCRNNILNSPKSSRKIASAGRFAGFRAKNTLYPPVEPFPHTFFLKKRKENDDNGNEEEININFPPTTSTSTLSSITDSPPHCRYKILESQAERFRLESQQRISRTAPSIFRSVNEDKLRKIYGQKATMLLNKFLSPHYNASSDEYYLRQCFDQIEPIGVGSFGLVVKGRSLDDGKFYAIKYNKYAFQNLRIREEALDEVRRQDMIPHHRNLANIYCAWEERGRIFVQMRLGIAGCLSELCVKSRRYRTPLAEEKVWRYFIDILLAVDHLHANNILHCDIKPDNIFVTEEDSCILGDFSHIFDNRHGAKRNRDENFGDGKYLAPEFSCGRPTIESDVFSLGISLLEIATLATMPSTPRDLRFSTSATNDIKEYVPLSMLNFIEKMTAKNANARPTTKEILSSNVIQNRMNADQRFAYNRYLKSSALNLRTVLNLIEECHWIAVIFMAIVHIFLKPFYFVRDNCALPTFPRQRKYSWSKCVISDHIAFEELPAYKDALGPIPFNID